MFLTRVTRMARTLPQHIVTSKSACGVTDLYLLPFGGRTFVPIIIYVHQSLEMNKRLLLQMQETTRFLRSVCGAVMIENRVAFNFAKR